ncbi:MAG: hypothetical protein ACRDOD_10785 [Streptosporangiaceae bacterium]
MAAWGAVSRAGGAGCGGEYAIRSRARSTMPGSAARSWPARSTVTGTEPAGQATSPSRCPVAGEPVVIVISVTGQRGRRLAQ